MKTNVNVSLLLLLCLPIYVLAFNPFEGPKPIAVLIQTNPWRMVIGSDTPLIAVYENGQVLYLRRDEDNTSKYLHKQLDSTEFDSVKNTLASFGDYENMNSYYNLTPNVTDQPETKIYLSYDDVDFVTSVYGLRVSDTKLRSFTAFDDNLKSDELMSRVV